MPQTDVICIEDCRMLDAARVSVLRLPKKVVSKAAERLVDRNEKVVNAIESHLAEHHSNRCRVDAVPKWAIRW